MSLLQAGRIFGVHDVEALAVGQFVPHPPQGTGFVRVRSGDGGRRLLMSACQAIA